VNESGIRELNMRKTHTTGSTVEGSEFPRTRKSRCAGQARAAELARLRRLSIEERILAALSMSDHFSWLQPTAKGR
jgi:hypothetical protein